MSGTTPGPWYCRNDRHDDGVTIVNDDNTPVARVNADTVTEDLDEALSPQGKANARLIAAAPELLEVLEALVVACSAHSLACQSRRIDARRRDADEYGQLPCNCTQALALANGRAAIKKARGQ